uniref:Uncharacterized protein n=1 Tax=Ditylenchus dipsaci TaxID=166011 RepID=A0A915EHU0_9BILA
MQIQYGKVQEKVLVRSLINNFCRMHALNPAHFRYQNFYEWEKFLYDQLKLIYLEERDRIQFSAANAAHLMALNGSNMSSSGLSGPASSKFDNRLHKAAPLDDRLRELTRIYSSSTTTSTARHAAANSRITNEIATQKKRVFSRKVSAARAKANDAAKSPAKNGSKSSEVEAVAGGKRCECLGKHLLIS